MIIIEKVTTQKDLQSCFDIRYAVFVKGQNVSLAEEMDGNDDKADHYLLRYDTNPVATARIRYNKDVATIERVAVLNKYQGKGLGMRIMLHMIEKIECTPSIRHITLGAQLHAIPFYKKCGFHAEGEPYIDANILHKTMVRNVKH